MARTPSPPPPSPPSMSREKGQQMLGVLSERGKKMLEGQTISEAALSTWKNYTREILAGVYGSGSKNELSFARAGVRGLVYADFDEQVLHREELTAKIEMIDSILEMLALDIQHTAATVSASVAPTTAAASESPTSVFIVHGHDDASKIEVARLLERLGVKPIILHEQVNAGKTVIEKFEANAALASFAIVLLTPDDVGGSKSGAPSPRARQNVVLEMGYFVGRLGRAHVCPLYVKGVELPSDLLGVAYTELDSGGAWKVPLAKELKAAGFAIDFNKLF